MGLRLVLEHNSSLFHEPGDQILSYKSAMSTD
jgi:hypothetical protein